jgi:hypothetical protein
MLGARWFPGCSRNGELQDLVHNRVEVFAALAKGQDSPRAAVELESAEGACRAIHTPDGIGMQLPELWREGEDILRGELCRKCKGMSRPTRRVAYCTLERSPRRACKRDGCAHRQAIIQDVGGRARSGPVRGWGAESSWSAASRRRGRVNKTRDGRDGYKIGKFGMKAPRYQQQPRSNPIRARNPRMPGTFSWRMSDGNAAGWEGDTPRKSQKTDPAWSKS